MSLPRALFVSLRPHQWLKNLVVLAALVFSKHLFEADAAAQAALAFAVFCALAGAVYLVNDLADLERDRLHPAKRTRPLASGELPPGLARAAAALLVVCGARRVVDPGPGLRAVRSRVPRARRRLLARAQARRDPRRAGGGTRLRAAGGGGRRRDRRPLQPLAAGVHHPARAVPGPRQAPARAGDARRRRRPPPDPRGVQPVPARPDDRGRDRVVPHGLRLLHARPRDGREVPHRAAGAHHPFRDLRHLPLSLPGPSPGRGRQPGRRAAHGPPAAASRSRCVRPRWC